MARSRWPMHDTGRCAATRSTAAMSARRGGASVKSPSQPCSYQMARHAKSVLATPMGSTAKEAWKKRVKSSAAARQAR